jgi:hypothetical protein
MAAFVRFMNRAFGRFLRIVLGIAFILYGLLLVGGTAGLVIAAVGLVPIALGAWGHCAPEFSATCHAAEPCPE